MVQRSIRLLLLASLVAATPAAAYQTRVSVRVQQADSLVLLRGELQQMTLEQETLLRDLRLAAAAARNAASETQRERSRARVLDLTTRLARSVKEAEALQAHLQAMCVDRPAPEGWLGINISETLDMTESPTATAYVFRRYPELISVEPGSPAQKAGLAPGDEIIALGGHDMVSGPLDIGSLLKPGAQLVVRFRRGGDLRRVNVLVEPRPEGFTSCPWIQITSAPMIALQPKLRVLELPNGGIGYVYVDSGGAVGAGARARQRFSPQVRGTPVLPPTPYAPLRLQSMVTGLNAIVAGAVLVPLGEMVSVGLGVEEGILVYDVLSGSPALEAGLRPGDIITRVNGQKVQTIQRLRAALDKAEWRDVEFQVSRRNAATRTVRLRP